MISGGVDRFATGDLVGRLSVAHRAHTLPRHATSRNPRQGATYSQIHRTIGDSAAVRVHTCTSAVASRLATLALAGESECILSVEGDVDEIVRRAQAAAATIVTEPAQHPWGYTGASADPDGVSGW